jgi:hypothetical protein
MIVLYFLGWYVYNHKSPKFRKKAHNGLKTVLTPGNLLAVPVTWLFKVPSNIFCACWVYGVGFEIGSTLKRQLQPFSVLLVQYLWKVIHLW